MADQDRDGWSTPEDCADEDGTIFPGADEIPYDGLDQDCDGADLADVDGDGADSTLAGGEDCDDEDGGIGPEAEETCGDGVDQDCDGVADQGCTSSSGAEDIGGLWWACSAAPPVPWLAVLAMVLVVRRCASSS